MKVLDLQCGHGHVFEAWFASEQDFHHQMSGGLLHCPLCDDACLTKLPSAPRLQLGSKCADPVLGSEPANAVPVVACEARSAPVGQDLEAAWLSWSRKVIASTEDVGADFPELARQMHQGDIPDRPIRGSSTVTETLALLEEGVPILPLGIAPTAKETLQ